MTFIQKSRALLYVWYGLVSVNIKKEKDFYLNTKPVFSVSRCECVAQNIITKNKDPFC